MFESLPHQLCIDGATIHFGVSGQAGPDILLVHGGGAHFKWWEPIAPVLEKTYRVIALDLSGHGNSDHRATYSPDLWAHEIVSVLDEVEATSPLFVGHSMGGRLGITFAANYPERLAGLIILESTVKPSSRYQPHRGMALKDLTPRHYPTLSVALDHFRLWPHQWTPEVEVLKPLARYSVRPDDQGWTWKADPRALFLFEDEYVDNTARKVQCPVVVVYGSHSALVDSELAEYAAKILNADELIQIEGAAHHVILDRPGICADIITRTARRLFDSADE